MYGESLRSSDGDGGAWSRLEECISSVVKVLREGRKDGARDFYITEKIQCIIGSDVYR